MKKILSVLSITIIAVFMSVSISYASCPNTQLTDDNYNETSPPHINDNGDIVWTKDIGTPYSVVFLYNSSTSTITQLTPDYSVQPQINNIGDVVWVGQGRSEIFPSYEIFLYDSSTSTITQLTDNDRLQYDLLPQINDNGDVVWNQIDYTEGVHKLFFYDSSTSTITHIADNPDFLRHHINAEGDIVWMGWDGSDYEIYFYDSATSTITQITDNNIQDVGYPQISDNGNLVWQSNDGTGSEIFLYDSSTSTITQLTDNDYWDRQPQINANGDVVWNRSSEIFLYDSSTSTITQLTNNNHLDHSARISDNGDVVWYGGTSMYAYKIFLYNSSTSTIITLSDNNYSNASPQINANGDVVWIGQLYVSDQEIYFHKRAPEIKHDGIDQDCNGYDLTIDINKANHESNEDSLRVEATSALGETANLELVDYGPMTWKARKQKWIITAEPAGEDPGTVTVCGIEGCESAPTKAE